MGFGNGDFHRYFHLIQRAFFQLTVHPTGNEIFFCNVLSEKDVPDDADKRQKNNRQYPCHSLDGIPVLRNHHHHDTYHGEEVKYLHDQE